MAIGPYDLAAGVDFLTVSRDKGFPWLSANLLDIHRKHLFQPSIIKEFKGFNVGLIGLTGRVSKLSDSYILASYQDVLKEELEKLSDQCDFIILLSSLSPKENKQISLDYPNINIIFSATGHGSNTTPRLSNNSIITQTLSKGKYQGLLSITLGNTPKWKSSNEQIVLLENRLGSLDWQLKRMNSRKELHSLEYQKKIDKIEKNRTAIIHKITTLREKEKREESQDIKPASFTSSFLDINLSISEEDDIKNEITDIKRKINKHNKELRNKRRAQNKEKLTESIKTDIQFAGFLVCAECHKPQTEFWKQTAHASSYKTLVKKNQNFNHECIICHVTVPTDPILFKKTDRQKLLDLPPSLQLIGCESCHYPGPAHAKSPNAVLPLKVEEHMCLNCHTEEQNDQFEFNKKRALIRCPTG